MPDTSQPVVGNGAPARRTIGTSVAHNARVHDYWLGGKDNFAADRAAGDAVMAAYPGSSCRCAPTGRSWHGPCGSWLPVALSQVTSDIQAEQMAEAARRYNRLARETQRHRTHAEVARFFDGLDLAEPGLVPVQHWRPDSESEAANSHSAMWGGVARKG
jgi:hypothetical protein